jgi:hypothetical protein
MSTPANATHQQILPEFIYELAGDGISISFNPDPGPPTTEGPVVLHYRDRQHTLDLHPEQIRTEMVADLGLCLSFTVEQRGDAGSVSASVLFPAVVLDSGQQIPVQTVLLTTTHEIPPVVSLNGQREHYRVTTLTGEATNPVAWPRAKSQS